MKPQRWLTACLLALAVTFTACDRSVIEKRAEEIRERNAANERFCIPLAVRAVRENWLVKGNEWFGKMRDGSLVKLRLPVVNAVPLQKGKPYSCRWMGEISITAERWETHPPVDTSVPFSMSYTVLVQDSKRLKIMETTGPDITAPEPHEVLVFQKEK